MTTVNVYAQLLGWIPWWVWAAAIVFLLGYGGWVWRRSRVLAGRGTLQQQRDRSSQWAGARDVDGLGIGGPDSRRLPLGELKAARRPRMVACPVGGSKLVVAPPVPARRRGSSSPTCCSTAARRSAPG